MKRITELSELLKDAIPTNVLNHYADLQRLTVIGVCGVFVMNNADWADRLFSDASYFSQSDIVHDFTGLMVQDEHFVPRI